MIGDIILNIRKFWKQHFSCIHDYETIHRKDLHGGSFECCTKCDKIC